MSDVVLQVLLILAYLAIGLMAITFPIYTICVTFLPQEKWESKKEREKRIEKLRAKISELTRQLKGEQRDTERVTQLKEQLVRYESELKGTEFRDYYLTARGAVGQPVIYLALALLSVGLGMYFFELETLEGVIAFGFVSSLCSAMAVQRLYKTITAVEYAALRPARTIEFAVDFGEGGKTTHKIKRGQIAELTVAAGTLEEDLEHVLFCVYVHPEIEIKDVLTDEASFLQPKGAEFPGYTCVMRTIPYIHKGTHEIAFFSVLPKKVGIYKVPVKVCAKGIYEYHAWLTLNVVK